MTHLTTNMTYCLNSGLNMIVSQGLLVPARLYLKSIMSTFLWWIQFDCPLSVNMYAESRRKFPLSPSFSLCLSHIAPSQLGVDSCFLPFSLQEEKIWLPPWRDAPTRLSVRRWRFQLLLVHLLYFPTATVRTPLGQLTPQLDHLDSSSRPRLGSCWWPSFLDMFPTLKLRSCLWILPPLHCLCLLGLTFWENPELSFFLKYIHFKRAAKVFSNTVPPLASSVPSWPWTSELWKLHREEAGSVCFALLSSRDENGHQESQGNGSKKNEKKERGGQPASVGLLKVKGHWTLDTEKSLLRQHPCHTSWKPLYVLHWHPWCEVKIVKMVIMVVMIHIWRTRTLIMLL